MMLFDRVRAARGAFQEEYAGRYQETWISDRWALERTEGVPIPDGQSPNDLCIAVRTLERSPELPETYQGIPIEYVTK